MSDEEKTTETTETTEERRVPESALKNQAADFASKQKAYEAKISELEGYQSDNEATKAQAEEIKAREAGELEKILDKYKTSVSDLNNTVASLTREGIVVAAKEALRGLGMEDEGSLSFDGALAVLPGDMQKEGVADWAAALKEAKPGDFTSTPNPVTQPRAGTPAATVVGTDLKSRLSSDDVEVKRAALREELQLSISGQLPRDH